MIVELHMAPLRTLEARKAPEHRGFARARGSQEDGQSRIADRMLPSARDDGAGAARVRGIARTRIAKFDVDVEQAHSDSVRRCSEYVTASTLTAKTSSNAEASLAAA